ncbi:MAG: hypothetical protein LRZ88_01910, partial [Candidatus Cloacimonetes bacterium]|nr:hypothetical protein [Candidatus Cloacimonadota bacterium]
VVTSKLPWPNCRTIGAQAGQRERRGLPFGTGKTPGVKALSSGVYIIDLGGRRSKVLKLNH